MVVNSIANQATSPGGLLLVLAHPDDETFAGGATLALHARHGHSTALLCFTDGQAGRLGPSGKPPLADREHAGALRRAELTAAASLFGIHTLITPGWMDGQLAQRDEQDAVSLIASVIRRLRPAVLLSFGAEGAPNRHPDHILTALWTQRAFDAAADPAWPVEADLPPHAVHHAYWITWPGAADHLRGTSGAPITHSIELGAEIDALKRRALLCHASQADHLPVFLEMCDIMQGREYFHLTRTRATPPPGDRLL